MQTITKKKKINIINTTNFSNDTELLIKISEAKKGFFIDFEDSYNNGLNKLKF